MKVVFQTHARLKICMIYACLTHRGTEAIIGMCRNKKKIVNSYFQFQFCIVLLGTRTKTYWESGAIVHVIAKLPHQSHYNNGFYKSVTLFLYL